MIILREHSNSAWMPFNPKEFTSGSYLSDILAFHLWSLDLPFIS